MKSKSSWSLSILLAALCVAIGSSQADSWRPTKKFEQPKGHGVYVMNLQSGKTRLMGNWYDWSPSPDGQWIVGGTEVVQNNRATGQYAVYSCGTQQGKSKLLTRFKAGTDFGASFHWSKDSRSCTLIGSGFDDKVLVKRFDISRPGRVVNLPARRFSSNPNLHFSSDGACYAATLPSDSRVLVIKASKGGKELARLSVDRPSQIESWSRDGKWLLFVKEGEYADYPKQNDRLCTWRIGENTSRDIVTSFTNISDAAYSPDGQWIIAACGKGFYQDASFQGGLYLLRANGSNLMRVTQNIAIQKHNADDREVCWIDNHSIAFRRTSYEDEGI
jgi:Tol biopolymer transport system component